MAHAVHRNGGKQAVVLPARATTGAPSLLIIYLLYVSNDIIIKFENLSIGTVSTILFQKNVT